MAKNLIKSMKFKNLKPSDREQFIADGEGLFVRVRSKKDGGGISFILRYTLAGKQHKITLPVLTLAEARKQTITYKEIIKKGINPIVEKKIELARNTQEQQDFLADLAKQNSRQTGGDVFNTWFRTDLLVRVDRTEIYRLFHKDVLPIIGAMYVEEIKKTHITQIINMLKQRGVLKLARNTLKLLRQMFRFALNCELIDVDPTASLNITQTTCAATERERNLSELEIKALTRQLPDANLLKSTQCAIWIALSTLCRVGELTKVEITEIDFENKVWNIPREHTKGKKKARTIFLSDFALTQFKILVEFSTHPKWLFPNRTNTGHVCLKSITKQIDGRQNDTIHKNRCKHNFSLILPDGKWTIHDLRRTGATRLGELGYDSTLIEKMLGHTESNKLIRTYQRQELIIPKKEAWIALGEYLTRITQPEIKNMTDTTPKKDNLIAREDLLNDWAE